jgi:hypothetical protein
MALAICELLRDYDIKALFSDEKTREIMMVHRDWGLIVNKFVNLVMDFYGKYRK